MTADDGPYPLWWARQIERAELHDDTKTYAWYMTERDERIGSTGLRLIPFCDLVEHGWLVLRDKCYDPASPL
jgi:hypothetical protein